MKKLIRSVLSISALFLAGNAMAAQISFVSVTGNWHDATDNSNSGTPTITNGDPLSYIRWGTPSGGGTQQSEYDFTKTTPASQTVPPTPPLFVLGTFKHKNFPITGVNLTSVKLDVVLTLSVDGAPRPPLTFTYTFNHDETPNNANPCKYPTPSGEECVDRVTIAQSPTPTTFTINGTEFTLKLYFVDPATGNGIDHFDTREQLENEATILGQFTATTPAVCGNTRCEISESCSSCSSDCGVCPPPPPATCGNHSCDSNETCSTCPGDCGSCTPPPSCGNNVCGTGESCGNCTADCGICPPPPPPVCGNARCDVGESCSSCSSDCGVCPPPPPVTCGNNSCDSGETCSNCSADCGACTPPPSCGNGTCGSGESCGNCMADCGICPPPPPVTCGNNSCDSGETCTNCSSDCGVCPPPPANVSKIVVTPATAMVSVNATRSFSAQAFDQNNAVISGVTFNWTVSGSQNTMSPSNGTSSTFTAGSATGSFTVTASASSKSGTAQVTVLGPGSHAGATDINNAKPHPVPYKSTSGLGGVTFSGLAPGTKIRIFSTDGRLVKTMHSDTGADLLWTVDNASGEKVSSSVYFYIIDYGSQTKKGKLVIIQ